MTEKDWEFVYAHEKEPVAKLMLQKQLYPEVNMPWAVTQIEARQKVKDKLPSWYKTKGLEFPPRVSVEQSSSEATAGFKAGLFYGKKMIDLTGGFGVDAFHFAKKFNEVIYCEQNPDLCTIINHNKEVLALKNVQIEQGDGLTILKKQNTYFDLIYLDPARRDNHNRKVVSLADCQPNVLENLGLLFAKSKKILVKASPMLDISLAMKQLACVHKVWVVAVENEVKEILFELQENKPIPMQVSAVILAKNETKVYTFSNREVGETLGFSEPLTYLYEPNVAVLKADLQDRMATKSHLLKLHPNSQLFTSQEKIDYPGRVFQIQKTLSLNKKLLKREIPSGKANITVRNFPMDVVSIRKKTGLKEGGEVYLFATTLLNGKKVLIKCIK